MPDVREKLVELLKKFVPPIWTEDCEENRHPMCYDIHCAECIADRLITNGVTIQRWIPVEERLPGNEQVVIVCDIRENWIGCWEYRHGGEWADNYLTFSNSDITHWMPMPEPPKEDEDD